MLFKFGLFWKLILANIISWIFYILFGFEFTIVSMVATIIVILTKDKHFLV
tara:strand:- start:1198 stop:1350 length:153 start_codon:yes stop_codon:yes gene_type:complete